MTDDVEKRWNDPRALRAASRYALAVIVLALAVMAAAVGWAVIARPDDCVADTVLACTTAPRLVLALVPTSILLLGGIGAFVQTYRVWRAGGTWPIWHGAGWTLFIAMLLYLGISATVLAG
ncbi:hypothetical protein [Rhodococcus maanshanensis]|uniref:Uncharacterized protein n=1 Tax=Rhodococcus maanshanensis TaxID=183556 RepID=A0A1H7LQ03_9NOCA|nr:hypothetical protein [Rhodococcus maanshanensis]SEL00929.1 hypothetical protein SAMN05444583_105116 [Rhodococcus maanshanensis]